MTTRDEIIDLVRKCAEPDGDFGIDNAIAFFHAAQRQAYERAAGICEAVADGWDKNPGRNPQAAEIEKYKTLCDQMGNALSSLNRYASQQICEHTETYRGGAIWEICCQCEAKWADDEGGKPEFVEPVAITNAIAALKT